MKAKLKPFVGKWIIAEMEAWDQDFVNMEASGWSARGARAHFQRGLFHRLALCERGQGDRGGSGAMTAEKEAASRLLKNNCFAGCSKTPRYKAPRKSSE
jgi:hypothetical protein